MALTAAEEAQTRTLIAQQAAILALATNEPAIISNLGAVDVSLSDLVAASSLGDADLLFVRQGVTDKSIAWSAIKALIPPPATSPFQFGVMPKYTIANSGTTSLAIGAISVRSDDDTENIVVGALTKALSGTWVAGNAQNALDVGGAATANGTLHVFAIWNPTTSTGDYLFSASASSPTLPSGYTKKAYVCSLRLNSSTQFIPFTYRGSDLFLYTTPILDMNLVTVNTTASFVALTVPSGVQVMAQSRATLAGTTGAQISIIVTAPDETDAAPNSQNNDCTMQIAGTNVAFAVSRRSNTSAQLRFRSTNANCQLNLSTLGFTILR